MRWIDKGVSCPSPQDIDIEVVARRWWNAWPGTWHHRHKDRCGMARESWYLIEQTAWGFNSHWVGQSLLVFPPLFAFFLCVQPVTKNRKHRRPGDFAALERRKAKDKGVSPDDGDLQPDRMRISWRPERGLLVIPDFVATQTRITLPHCVLG